MHDCDWLPIGSLAASNTAIHKDIIKEEVEEGLYCVVFSKDSRNELRDIL